MSLWHDNMRKLEPFWEQRFAILGDTGVILPLVGKGDDGAANAASFKTRQRVAAATGSITAFADAGGGQVTVTSAGHGLVGGQTVVITGTTNYNGTFSITNVTTNTFEITDTWVSDDGTGTWTVNGGIETTFTWSEAPSAFDTPFDPASAASWQGIVPIITFNGTDEDAADDADDGYWELGDGTGDSVGSTGVWLNTPGGANGVLLIKGNGGADDRGWSFQVTSGDDIQFTRWDESVGGNPAIYTVTDTAIGLNQWVHVVATTDDSEAASGINIYVNGSLVASSDTNEAGYVATEDSAAALRAFSQYGSVYYNGSVAGGPLGPFFTQIELTAEQVKRDYLMGRALLGLN